MIRNFVLATLALAGMWVAESPAGVPPGRKPNILFILADDLGYGDVGCYGEVGRKLGRYWDVLWMEKKLE